MVALSHPNHYLAASQSGVCVVACSGISGQPKTPILAPSPLPIISPRLWGIYALYYARTRARVHASPPKCCGSPFFLRFGVKHVLTSASESASNTDHAEYTMSRVWTFVERARRTISLPKMTKKLCSDAHRCLPRFWLSASLQRLARAPPELCTHRA